jgi:hypothetical protein
MHTITVYQLDINNNDIFRDYEFVTRRGTFDINAYHKVWEGKMHINSLNKIYEVLNLVKPEGYVGHSLSVSDILIVDGEMFYVDDLGFVKLENMGVPNN